MKRILSTILLIAITLSAALICGCNGDQTYVAGEFYTLQEAYDNGYLTREDLESINSYNVEKPQDELSRTLEFSIRKTMVDALTNEIANETFELDNVLICGYYGTYNGCVAVEMIYTNGGDFALNEVIHEDIVAGIKFYYSNYTEFFRTKNLNFNNSIMIWKENS